MSSTTTRQVEVCLTAGRKTFEHFRVALYLTDEVIDISLFVTRQRYMHHRRQAEARLARIDQCRIPIDDTVFFQAFQPGARRRCSTCQRGQPVPAS